MKYNCSDCDYSTDDRRNWERHKKSKSHLKKEPEQTNSIKRQVDNNLTGTCTGTCTGICTCTYTGICTGICTGTYTGACTDHVTTTSTNDIIKAKYICPYCDKSFSSNSSLSRHKKHRCSKNIIESNDDLTRCIRISG
jgi:DNA-directed RNA polymerase subunit RPC12/RpoP